MEERGDPEGFLVGCAVSPFKSTEGETFAQYAKLCRKVSSGAHFLITQVGYDVRKFQELLKVQRDFGVQIPTLASIYHLTPKVAQIMNGGKIPGVVVTNKLLKTIKEEWRDKLAGRKAAIERSARLIAVVKGLGYRGVHIAGIHQSFETAAHILNRSAQIEHRWEEFVSEFDFPQENGFYVYRKDPRTGLLTDEPSTFNATSSRLERVGYKAFKRSHDLLFRIRQPSGTRPKPRCCSTGQTAGWASCDESGGGFGENAAARVSPLRRLRDPAHGLSLPGIAVSQAHPQRAMRRQPQRLL